MWALMLALLISTMDSLKYIYQFLVNIYFSVQSTFCPYVISTPTRPDQRVNKLTNLSNCIKILTVPSNDFSLVASLWSMYNELPSAKQRGFSYRSNKGSESSWKTKQKWKKMIYLFEHIVCVLAAASWLDWSLFSTQICFCLHKSTNLHIKLDLLCTVYFVIFT